MKNIGFAKVDDNWTQARKTKALSAFVEGDKKLNFFNADSAELIACKKPYRDDFWNGKINQEQLNWAYRECDFAENQRLEKENDVVKIESTPSINITVPTQAEPTFTQTTPTTLPNWNENIAVPPLTEPTLPSGNATNPVIKTDETKLAESGKGKVILLSLLGLVLVGGAIWYFKKGGKFLGEKTISHPMV